MAGALDGIRVLELATGVAGPYCGKILAGLGAEVIKVEPTEGDESRQAGPFPGDLPDPERSGLFLHLNTGKQSITRPTTDAGWSDLAGLQRTCDVAIEDGMSWSIEDVSARHDWLITASITPFGRTGPYASYRGNELVCYALSGYMSLTGARDREPLKAWGELLHFQAGLQAAAGILAALRARETTGRGQHVDVSIMEAGTFLLGGADQQAFFYGRAAKRNGARLLGFPPEHTYPSTIRPCKDGYVHAHSNNRHLDLLAAMIGEPRLAEPDLLATMMGHADEIDALMDPWLATRTKREVVETAQAMRLPFTEVLSPAEVLADPHNAARGSFVEVEHPGGVTVRQPGPPMRLSATPWVTRPAPTLGQHNGAARPEDDGRAGRFAAIAARGTPQDRHVRPLSGVRVVDFTNAVAGPVATSVLADLGAEVIKVESPAARPRKPGGTAPLRPGAPDEPWNRMATYNELNHGKLGCTLDITQPEGRGIFLDLVAKSDVVVQNFSPRAIDNMGLGYETLRSANPSIIAVSMPAFGLDGPYRDRGSYGPGIDAMSGFSHLTGYTDGPPMKPGNFFCDQNAALLAVNATLAALRHRDRTGEGQHCELSMLEGEFQLVADALLDYEMNGYEQARRGNSHPDFAPHDVFPCAGDDQWVAIAIEDDGEWQGFCLAIQDEADTSDPPALGQDPRFATTGARREHSVELDALIADWTSTRTPNEAQRQLQLYGVRAGAVLDPVQLLQDPHVLARGGYEYVETPGVGPSPVPRVAFRLEGTPCPVAGPAPRFGEHNRYVLGDLLGLSDAVISSLESRRIIATEPPPPE